MHPMEYTINISQINLIDHINLNIMPEYYKTMLEAVVKLNNIVYLNPTNVTEIKNQLLWENRYITSNEKSIYFKVWLYSGFKTIGDIIVNNRILTPGEIIPNIREKQNGLMEYFTLINAIAKAWKVIIARDNTDKQEGYKNQSLFHRNNKGPVYYSYFVNERSNIPISQRKWEIELNNVNIDWNKVWHDKVFKMKHIIKIAQFNFKFLHRILPCKKRLKIWNLTNNDLCDKCLNAVEDELHMFVKCKTIQRAWNRFKTVIMQCFPTESNITWDTIVSGSKNKLVNELTSLFIFCIYKSCLLAKVDKQDKHESTIIWKLFTLEIKNLIANEYKCNFIKAQRKWDGVKNIIFNMMK